MPDRDRKGRRAGVLPSRQTGRADFPQPAFQSVGHLLALPNRPLWRPIAQEFKAIRCRVYYSCLFRMPRTCLSFHALLCRWRHSPPRQGAGGLCRVVLPGDLAGLPDFLGFRWAQVGRPQRFTPDKLSGLRQSPS